RKGPCRRLTHIHSQCGSQGIKQDRMSRRTCKFGPDSQHDPSTWTQDTINLLQSSLTIGEKLQSLLTNNEIKKLISKRKVLQIAWLPLDIRAQASAHRDHPFVEIQANRLAGSAYDGSHESRDHSGSAAYIQDVLA